MLANSRRSFLTQCVGSTILVACARSAASAATPTAIRVGVIGGDFAAQPYFANDMGFFEKVGLKAEIIEFNNGPAIAAAIAGGALDVGYSNVISLVIAHDKGLPFTIIAGAYIYRPSTATTGLLSVLKTSPIQNAKDFTGKTIAVGALYNVTDLATRAWIDNNGGDSTSVHFVEMPASAFTEAIKSGRIDAAPIDASLDPQLGKAGSSLRLVGKAFDSIGSNYTVGGWFTTKGLGDQKCHRSKGIFPSDESQRAMGEHARARIGRRSRQVPEDRSSTHRVAPARRLQHEHHAGRNPGIDRRRRAL
jgi:NitT/TauT family transport system substrate-binding protein